MQAQQVTLHNTDTKKEYGFVDAPVIISVWYLYILRVCSCAAVDNTEFGYIYRYRVRQVKLGTSIAFVHSADGVTSTAAVPQHYISSVMYHLHYGATSGSNPATLNGIHHHPCTRTSLRAKCASTPTGEDNLPLLPQVAFPYSTSGQILSLCQDYMKFPCVTKNTVAQHDNTQKFLNIFSSQPAMLASFRQLVLFAVLGIRSGGRKLARAAFWQVFRSASITPDWFGMKAIQPLIIQRLTAELMW